MIKIYILSILCIHVNKFCGLCAFAVKFLQTETAPMRL